MPALPPATIIDRVLSAISASGAQGTLISSIRSHPRVFRVVRSRLSYDIWVYIWTVTHGGATRSEDEFRIQMTSVQSPLPTNPDGPTILVGWDEERGVFAGFDFLRHQTFTQGSPSVQVPLGVLREAQAAGISIARKSNEEITYAFTPENFLAYAEGAQAYHQEGARAQAVLRQVIAEPQARVDLAQLPAGRRRVIQEVATLSRDSRFRNSVLDAYGHKCAVTGIQLGLLDAAHILAVGAERSHDGITNGLALSPTYHRAYDSALIYLTEDFVMRINLRRAARLRSDGKIDGLDSFERTLGRRIHLPADERLYPDREMIRLSNALRGIGR